MKMKQLLILVGIVVVLWLVFVLLDRSSVPTAEADYLVEVDTTEVDELEIMSGASTITLANTDGGWMITNPEEYPANPRYVSQLLEKLADMRIESEVTGKKSRWEEFEVDTAGVQLTVREGDDATSIVLGKAAESYQQSYARYADKETVYLVNGTYKMLLSRSLDNWKDKAILRHEAEDITGLATDAWTLTRDGEQWSLAAGGEQRNADPAAAGRVQSQVARMRTSSFPTAEELAAVDFKAAPDATLEVTLQSGETIPVRFWQDPNNERRYFVRTGEGETTFLLFEGIYNQIFKDVDELTAASPETAEQAG